MYGFRGVHRCVKVKCVCVCRCVWHGEGMCGDCVFEGSTCVASVPMTVFLWGCGCVYRGWRWVMGVRMDCMCLEA